MIWFYQNTPTSPHNWVKCCYSFVDSRDDVGVDFCLCRCHGIFSFQNQVQVRGVCFTRLKGRRKVKKCDNQNQSIIFFFFFLPDFLLLPIFCISSFKIISSLPPFLSRIGKIERAKWRCRVQIRKSSNFDKTKMETRHYRKSQV